MDSDGQCLANEEIIYLFFFTYSMRNEMLDKFSVAFLIRLSIQLVLLVTYIS